jgi:gas vesicle protein
MANCTACGNELPPNSKFCFQCGTAVAVGDTVVEEVPIPEPAPAPVEPQVGERRFFGVVPSSMLLLLVVAGLVFAIVLFALGEWPWALIVLGLSGFAATGLFTQARRLPGETSGVTKASLGAVDAIRARGRAVVETVAAHGSARMELSRLRREIAALSADRSERVRELGAAAYEGNKAAEKDLKERIKQIDDDIQAKEAQMAKVTIDAQERIGRAKLEAQPTRIEEPESKPNTARE